MSHPFPRPPLACGEHLARCLRTAPPEVIRATIVFSRRVTGAVDCDPALAEIMAAVCLDATAVMYELDDLLADLGDV